MEDLLWHAAAALRGSGLHPEDYVHPLVAIATLLLANRDAERRETELLAQGATQDAAEWTAYNQPVALPEAARRRAFVHAGAEVREALRRALRSVEDVNPNTLGIFDVMDNLGSASDTTLHALVASLNELVNRSTEPSATVVLGLVRLLADGRKAAHLFIVPEEVTALLAGLARVEKGMVVGDFYCRCGDVLEGIRADALRRGVDGVELVGQELNLTASKIARLVALLAGPENMTVHRGEPLFDPLVQDGALRKFSRILGLVPFGMKMSPDQVSRLENDRHLRFSYGPGLHQNARELAYAQHCIAALAPGGRAVIQVVPGVLFRSGTEGEIRRALIQDDVLEAVISVPSGVLPFTAVASAVLVLNPNKPPTRRHQILLVILSGNAPRRGRVSLTNEEVTRAVSDFHDWREEEGFSKILTLEQVAEQGFVLTPVRYIERFEQPEFLNPVEVTERLRELEERRDAAARRIDELLAELDT